MLYPSDIFIDAAVRITQDPEYGSADNPMRLLNAIYLLYRAQMHLGIDGCALHEPMTDTVCDTLEPETWPCNDCGQPTLKGDELCGSCYEKEARERDNAEGDSFRTLGLCEADFR